MAKCKINPEHEISLEGGFCRSCAVCKHCHKPLTVLEWEHCLRTAYKSLKEDLETNPESSLHPTFQHQSCFSELERESLRNETITISKALFDKLNSARLLIDANMDLSTKVNQEEAALLTVRWLHEKTFEEQYVSLLRIESIASAMSLAVGKKRRDLETKLQSFDKERMEKVETYRQINTTEHKRKATKEQKTEKQANKAIQFLMDSAGLTKEEAEKSLTEMKTKKNQTIQ